MERGLAETGNSESAGTQYRNGQAAAARQAELTKPAGSLGRLEELAYWLAAWQVTPSNRGNAARSRLAGNHGVAAKGVSAYPPEVTVQMVANFEAGGAPSMHFATTLARDYPSSPSHSIDRQPTSRKPRQ